MHTTSRFTRGLSWTLRVFAGLAFFAAGVAKLMGVPMMVAVFEQIGAGQWFRIVTGVIEVIGAIALLLPATYALSATMLAGMMLVATCVHLLLIGGSPVPAIVLMLANGTLAWLNRDQLVTTLRTIGIVR